MGGIPNSKRVLFLTMVLFAPFSMANYDIQVRDGLKLLYKNANCSDSRYCLAGNEEALVKQAHDFKDKFDRLVNDAAAPRVNWKRSKHNVLAFEFDSLVQRENNHPSNKVVGKVFLPTDYKGFCNNDFPATILLHKLSDDDSLDTEETIAKMAASSNKGLVMIMYLPHFGPRKLAGTNFITGSMEEFQLNVFQTLADVHQSYLALKSLDYVQQDNIGLMGLSLGAMITLISAGLDPVFDRYATNVGGGDIANIMTYKSSGDVDSVTSKVLKDITWSVDQARFFLSQFDAITWSHNVQGKSILMINAENDELIKPNLSVVPLIEGYRAAGSNVKHITHRGTHVYRFREVGLKQSVTRVFLPMFNFIGKDAPLVNGCR